MFYKLGAEKYTLKKSVTNFLKGTMNSHLINCFVFEKSILGAIFIFELLKHFDALWIKVVPLCRISGVSKSSTCRLFG